MTDANAAPEPVPRAPLRDEVAGSDLRPHPGTRRPDRFRHVDSDGLSIAVWEWGEPDAPPVLFTHGGFDFAGTFDGLAPLVADAGWRVVSWDQRGHGDSERAHLYSWGADRRDALAVMDSIGTDPIPVVGHSKGGALMLSVADALPHRISHLANLDGLPTSRLWPDVPEHHRTEMRRGELAAWLDHRRAARTKIRRPGTIEDLADRRRRMNPRLSPEWLQYLVPIGGYQQADGWRWKIDASLRMGGFGPWRPEWYTHLLASMGMPVLCVLGLEVEVMGWGTLPEDVVSILPANGRFAPLENVGHFVHIEAPEVVAGLILELIS